MPYTAYVTAEEYSSLGYEGIPAEELENQLKQASRHIDILTFNRIQGRGISNLTAYQQELVKDVCCQMAGFEYDNADMINSVLQSYGINGVSMQFGNTWNMQLINGVAVKSDTYAELNMTGLCSRRVV